MKARYSNNLVFLIPFLILYILIYELHASDHKTPVPSKFLDHGVYQKGLSQKRIDFTERCLEKLSANIVGKELLMKIGAKLEEDKLELEIIGTEEGHSFYPSQKNDLLRLSLGINFTELTKSKQVNENNSKSHISTLGTQRLKGSHHSFYKVGRMSYPFHITIGHELIHLLHYLENPDEYNKFNTRFDDRLWKVYGNESNSRAPNLWRCLEEQRTVIGSQGKHISEEITEFSLLAAEKYAPRYAYQTLGDDFYEESSIVQEMFITRLKEDKELAKFKRENWQFDKEKAGKSRLNPQAFKDDFKERFIEAEKENMNETAKMLGEESEEEKKERLERLEMFLKKRQKKR